MPGYVKIAWKEVLGNIEDEDIKNIKDIEEIRKLLEENEGVPVAFFYTGNERPAKFKLEENELTGEGLLDFLKKGLLKREDEGSRVLYTKPAKKLSKIKKYNKLYQNILKAQKERFELIEDDSYFDRFNKDFKAWRDFFQFEGDKIIGIKEDVDQEQLKDMRNALREWLDHWNDWYDEHGDDYRDGSRDAGKHPPEPYVGVRRDEEFEIEMDSTEENVREHVNAEKFLTSFQRHTGKKLVELAKSPLIKVSGNPMSKDEFRSNMTKWVEKIGEGREDVKVEKEEDELSIKIKTILTTTDTSGIERKEEIEHSYSNSDGFPKVTMPNPPDDQTIYLFMGTSKWMQPLKLEAACGAKQAIRLFEASVITGVKLELTPQDEHALESSKEFSDRYKNLKAIQNDGDRLDAFRKQVAAREDYELGNTKVEELQIPVEMVFRGRPSSSS